VLHGIFFHRLFGVIKPSSIDCLDVTFPAVKDENTEKLVDETVDNFLRALHAVRQGRKEGQIEVLFTEKQQKKGNWFNSDKTVC
jgi:autophagy-related protein 101